MEEWFIAPACDGFVLAASSMPGDRSQAVLSQAAEGLAVVPRVIVTDRLKSYAAAQREILPSVEHRQSRYLNNRAEVSHQPTDDENDR